jgi:hypothetical protein
MSYQSRYKGEEIDNGIDKAMSAVQPKDLSSVAKSGDYNDLKNTPNIPSPVTEQTVTDWGFTKNKGDYSKPQGGIPKSDLSEEVKNSLNKADSALQEHQELKTINGNTIVGEGDIIIGSDVTAEEVSSSEPTVEFPQVLYVEQNLTEKQKAQAIKNIGVDIYVSQAIETSIINEINGDF